MEWAADYHFNCSQPSFVEHTFTVDPKISGVVLSRIINVCFFTKTESQKIELE